MMVASAGAHSPSESERPDAVIVDCGIGNIRSVKRMFEAVEGRATIVDNPDGIIGCRRLVLPGVGAFDAGMNALAEGGWIPALNRVALEEKAPVLGICLGMQLLCRRSEEGVKQGLSWIEADVIKIDPGPEMERLKIPHMGWAQTRTAKPNALISDDESEQRFYYVHKYRVVCDAPEDVLATATYGTEFTSAVHRDNIYGVQFHPEKSHRFGMALMRRFLDLPC
jgi:glutamine amidotransferase